MRGMLIVGSGTAGAAYGSDDLLSAEDRSRATSIDRHDLERGTRTSVTGRASRRAATRRRRRRAVDRELAPEIPWFEAGTSATRTPVA